MAPLMRVLRRGRALAGICGTVLLLTGCKKCGGSTDGGGYDSPVPVPRALISTR
jgi:hypothetical protein